MSIKAVIFDMDGTLHDSEIIHRRGWYRAAEEMNITGIEEDCVYCTGIGVVQAREYFERVHPDVDWEEFHSCAHKHINKIIDEGGIPKRKGAVELLEYLEANGIKMAVATSTPVSMARRDLELSGLLKYFDVVIGGDMVQNGKPNPDIFLMAAELLGVLPADCLGVEDSHNGIRALHAANIRAIFIPDLMEDTDELKKLYSVKLNSLDETVSLIEKE
ncbi:MAG: HAD family phosphatase [Ruminococcaceae bacterium]|nr:HAD family phosphatase [Oscillospiraceae bacterium]